MTTRSQTGTRSGQLPTAAIDQDLRSEGQSNGGGYLVEPAGRASPNEQSESEFSGAYALTEDSLANRGFTENFGLARPPPDGGMRALATVAAGATDLIAGIASERSLKIPAGTSAPAAPLVEHFPPRVEPSPKRVSSNKLRGSFGVPQVATPESRQLIGYEDIGDGPKMLASAMEPALGQQYLALVIMEAQARSDGNEVLANAYVQHIGRILEHGISVGSGSGTGSSSVASSGMGAGAMEDVVGTPQLSRDDIQQMTKEIEVAMRPILESSKESVTPQSAVLKVQALFVRMLQALCAVSPSDGTELAALVTVASSVPDEWVVLLGATQGVDLRGEALRQLKVHEPASPLDDEQHPYLAARGRLLMSYPEVIKREPRYGKLDTLLRSYLLQVLSPTVRQLVQTSGNCALVIDRVFQQLKFTNVQFMQQCVQRLGAPPAPLPADGAFVVHSAIKHLRAMYCTRVEQHTNELRIDPAELHLELVLQAFPVGEPGSPLAIALAAVKTRIQAQLMHSTKGRGHAANCALLDKLLQEYNNQQHEGRLVTADSDRSAFYGGPNPFGKKLKKSAKAASVGGSAQSPVTSDTDASDATSASEAESVDGPAQRRERGRLARRAGGGKGVRAPSPAQPQFCQHDAAKCPYLKNKGKCWYPHRDDPDEESAEGDGAASGTEAPKATWKKTGFMALAVRNQAAPASAAPRVKVTFAKSLSKTIRDKPVQKLKPAAEWSVPLETARRKVAGKYPGVAVGLHSRRKVKDLFRKFKVVGKPMYNEWSKASAAKRKKLVLGGVNFPGDMHRLCESARHYGIPIPRAIQQAHEVASRPLVWRARLRGYEAASQCWDGIQCQSLRTTGKCAKFHPRAEIAAAALQPEEGKHVSRKGRKRKSASVVSEQASGEKPASSSPRVKVAPKVAKAVNKLPGSLPGVPQVWLSRRLGKLSFIGDSGANVHTGNISRKFLHNVEQLPPDRQFKIQGVGQLVTIDKIATVYCKVRVAVFDTDAEVRSRFESAGYLGSDPLFYYFAVTMYPNEHMPKNVMLLSLGKLCKELGLRVVMDYMQGSASYALSPEQSGMRLAFRLCIGLEDQDEDDCLLTVPDIALVSPAELGAMGMFQRAEAEWNRAHERRQAFLQEKAAFDVGGSVESDVEVAPLVFYVKRDEGEEAYSLTESMHQF